MSIKNASLREIERIEILNEVSFLFKSILDMILNTLDGDSGSVMILDKKQKVFRIVCSKGLKEEALEKIGVPINKSIAGYSLIEGKALILNKGDTLVGYPLTREDIGSSIVFPIINNREKVGVININRSPSREPFTIEELELVSTLVRYSSLLMKGVILYNKVLESARIANFSYRTLRNISRYKNPVCVIKTLLKAMLEITHGLYGFAGVYEGGEFRVIASTKDNINEEEVKAEELFDSMRENRKEIISQDIVGFPIMYKEELLGAICIRLKDKGLDFKEIKTIRFLLKDAGIIIKNLTNSQEQKEISRQEERIRITNILHDRICQGVTEGIIRIQYMKKLDPTEEILDEIIGLETLLKEILNDIRCIMFEEKPLKIKGGFFDILRKYINAIEDKSNINFTLILNGNEEMIPKRIQEVLFSVIREAVVNIRRHSLASSAIVEVLVKENSVIINIQDNGIGFDNESYIDKDDSFGIKIMQDRISSLGGSFKIEGFPSKGTKVNINVPL